MPALEADVKWFFFFKVESSTKFGFITFFFLRGNLVNIKFSLSLQTVLDQKSLKLC